MLLGCFSTFADATMIGLMQRKSEVSKIILFVKLLSRLIAQLLNVLLRDFLPSVTWAVLEFVFMQLSACISKTVNSSLNNFQKRSIFSTIFIVLSKAVIFGFFW